MLLSGLCLASGFTLWNRAAIASQADEPGTPPSDVIHNFSDQDELFQTPLSHPSGMESGSGKQWGDKV